MNYRVETVKKSKAEVGSFVVSNASGAVYLIVRTDLGYGKYGLLDMARAIVTSYNDDIEAMLINKLIDGYRVLAQPEPLTLIEEV
jgi:hypothetical protein